VVRDHAADEKVRAVVLDARTISFVDITASQMLDELREDLSGRGVTLLLARDVGQVRDVLRHALTTPARIGFSRRSRRPLRRRRVRWVAVIDHLESEGGNE
jgi:MFS superfamily sulfate permease-like transporter